MASEPPTLPNTAHIIDKPSNDPDPHDPPETDDVGPQDDEREATELQPIGLYRTVTVSDAQKGGMIKKFWKRQICVTVDHEACRDHFGRSSRFLMSYKLRICWGARVWLNYPATRSCQ